MTFDEALTPRGRRLVLRLESFGDIVFGFSISQLALELGASHEARDVFTHPLRFVLFFGTFATIAGLWMRYHRIMTTAFAPHRLDLLLAFAFLAFTALLPFAQLTSVGSRSYDDARYGFAVYILCFFGTAATAMLLDVRAFRRARGLLEERDLRSLRRRAVLSAGVCACFLISLALDARFDVAVASCALFAIGPYSAIVRRLMPIESWSSAHVRMEKS